jgi:hypothetical protein
MDPRAQIPEDRFPGTDHSFWNRNLTWARKRGWLATRAQARASHPLVLEKPRLSGNPRLRGSINKLFYAEIPRRFGDVMLIILIILLLLFAFGGYRMGPGLGYYGGGGISLILLIIIILLLLRVI